MKSFMILVSVILSANASAGTCAPLADAHAGFCAGKTKSVCMVHSSVCEWNSTDEAVHVIIDRPQEKCEAQESEEAHEGFCAGKSKSECRVHESVCVWH